MPVEYVTYIFWCCRTLLTYMCCWILENNVIDYRILITCMCCWISWRILLTYITEYCRILTYNVEYCRILLIYTLVSDRSLASLKFYTNWTINPCLPLSETLGNYSTHMFHIRLTKITSYKYNHVVCVIMRNSLFFKAELYSTMHHHIFSTHLATNELSSCIHTFITMNYAAMDIGK